MRIGSASLLVLSAFALAACEGTPSTGSSTSNASLDLCGLACPDGTPDDDDDFVDANNDGIDDNADGNDGTDEGGNTTDLNPATSDVTIALQLSKLSVPASGTTALSTLTSSVTTSTTTSQILGPAKPPALTFRIDTNNSSTNGNFATPVMMPEHVPGSIATDITGGNNGGTNCLPDCGYREYRAVGGATGAERNEVLQVWAWNQSYATQYRNANGGDGPQQAWSFGGNRTPLADPAIASGNATYTGRFVGTAKSENWIKPSGADIDPNANWRVQGAASITADFDAVSVTGLLTPETWQSVQEGYGGDYMWTVGTLGTVAEPDYDIYNSTVSLNGTITGNTYAGSATLNQTFIDTSADPVNNPMYGGFFGAGATETTGIFHVYGVDPFPLGGSAGHNGDAFGYLTINGAFNGN